MRYVADLSGLVVESVADWCWTLLESIDGLVGSVQVPLTDQLMSGRVRVESNGSSDSIESSGRRVAAETAL